jgi:pyruvate,orthophosphate dikinase
VANADKLEKHYRDIRIWSSPLRRAKLYKLHTRNGKRTAPAALKIAVTWWPRYGYQEEALLKIEPSS